jgi:hypothetical protein
MLKSIAEMNKAMERHGQLEQEMMPTDVSKARELADECLARGYKEC